MLAPLAIGRGLVENSTKARKIIYWCILSWNTKLIVQLPLGCVSYPCTTHQAQDVENKIQIYLIHSCSIQVLAARNLEDIISSTCQNKSKLLAHIIVHTMRQVAQSCLVNARYYY